MNEYNQDPVCCAANVYSKSRFSFFTHHSQASTPNSVSPIVFQLTCVQLNEYASSTMNSMLKSKINVCSPAALLVAEERCHVHKSKERPKWQAAQENPLAGKFY